MPFARLTIAEPDLPASTQQHLVDEVTRALARDLGKDPSVTVVQVNLVPAQRWFVDTRRHHGTTGAHLEVSITAGTNTREEKAAFLNNAYRLLADTLGALPPAVYVALYEPQAESYGYNGVSQLVRHDLS